MQGLVSGTCPLVRADLNVFVMICTQVWLALLGVLCVGLSIGVSFGIASAFGIFYGPVHSTLPFLLLGEYTEKMSESSRDWGATLITGDQSVL